MRFTENDPAIRSHERDGLTRKRLDGLIQLLERDLDARKRATNTSQMRIVDNAVISSKITPKGAVKVIKVDSKHLKIEKKQSTSKSPMTKSGSTLRDRSKKGAVSRKKHSKVVHENKYDPSTPVT